MGKGGFGKGSKESEGKEEEDMVNWKMRVNGEKKSDKKKLIENKNKFKIKFKFKFKKRQNVWCVFK